MYVHLRVRVRGFASSWDSVFVRTPAHQPQPQAQGACGRAGEGWFSLLLSRSRNSEKLCIISLLTSSSKQLLYISITYTINFAQLQAQPHHYGRRRGGGGRGVAGPASAQPHMYMSMYMSLDINMKIIYIYTYRYMYTHDMYITSRATFCGEEGERERERPWFQLKQVPVEA